MSKYHTLCIAVLTLNEERRIEQCIRSAEFADQIIVADSGSTDKTVALARAMGAAVYSYPNWQGFGEQRNRLLKHCTADYIFFLDADEVIPAELEKEINNIVQSGANGVWEVLWNQVAFGKPLTRMKSTSGIPRLFRYDNLIRYEGLVHEAAVLKDGKVPVFKLKARLLHYSRETIYSSLQKLAQYAQLGALKRTKKGKTGGVLRGFASALANFLQLYLLRRGFLCGPEGFMFCLFIALECFFRYAMIKYDKESSADIAKRG